MHARSKLPRSHHRRRFFSVFLIKVNVPAGARRKKRAPPAGRSHLEKETKKRYHAN
jgi:hypothetical protein